MINQDYLDAIEKINKEYPSYDYELEFVTLTQKANQKPPKGMDKADFNTGTLAEVGLTIFYPNKTNVQLMKCVLSDCKETKQEWIKKVNESIITLNRKRGL